MSEWSENQQLSVDVDFLGSSETDTQLLLSGLLGATGAHPYLQESYSDNLFLYPRSELLGGECEKNDDLEGNSISSLDALDVSSDSSSWTNLQRSSAVKKTPKKSNHKRLTDEEKLQKRANQTRAASRLYRQRQKELISSLQLQLSEMSAEQNKTKNSEAQLISEIMQLKAEISQYQRSPGQIAQIIEENRWLELKKLETLVKANAPDHEILPVLESIQSICQEVNKMGICHVNEIMQNFQSRGYLQDSLFNLNSSGGIVEVSQRILVAIPGITPLQLQHIHETLTHHDELLVPIIQERNILRHSLEQFSEVSILPDKRSIHGISGTSIQSSSIMNRLKSNLYTESQLWEESLKNLVSLFTPRQLAAFFLKVEYEHRSAQQLFEIWNAFKAEAI